MINAKMVEQISKTAAEAAVKAAAEYLEKEKLQHQKTKQDRRLRNTKLLLKHYRSFERHCAKLELKLTAIQEAQTINELQDADFEVESIKKSEKRTIVMVQYIRQALDHYHDICERNGREDDLRRYHIVEGLYISKDKIAPETLAEKYKIDQRTVYKDVDNACKTLSVLMFGVDAIQFE